MKCTRILQTTASLRSFKPWCAVSGSCVIQCEGKQSTSGFSLCWDVASCCCISVAFRVLLLQAGKGALWVEHQNIYIYIIFKVFALCIIVLRCLFIPKVPQSFCLQPFFPFVLRPLLHVSFSVLFFWFCLWMEASMPGWRWWWTLLLWEQQREHSAKTSKNWRDEVKRVADERGMGGWCENGWREWGTTAKMREIMTKWKKIEKDGEICNANFCHPMWSSSPRWNLSPVPAPHFHAHHHTTTTLSVPNQSYITTMGFWARNFLM